MKIKLGLLNKDLSFRLGSSEQTVTRIYRSWLQIVAENVKFLIVWPEKHDVRRDFKITKIHLKKKQMSSDEVDESRQIPHVRIHVERVIGR